MKLEEIEEYIAGANLKNEKLIHKLLAVAKAAKECDANGILGCSLSGNKLKSALEELEKEETRLK